MIILHLRGEWGCDYWTRSRWREDIAQRTLMKQKDIVQYSRLWEGQVHLYAGGAVTADLPELVRPSPIFAGVSMKPLTPHSLFCFSCSLRRHTLRHSDVTVSLTDVTLFSSGEWQCETGGKHTRNKTEGGRRSEKGSAAVKFIERTYEEMRQTGVFVAQ